MTYLNCPLPSYFTVLVRREFTRDLIDGQGEYIPATVHGITAIAGRCLSFHVVFREPAGGAMWARLPIHALCTKKCNPLTVREAQPWDCPSYHLAVTEWPILKGIRARARIGNDWREGVYQFAVDYAESGLAEDPEQHKSANVIFLDEGQIVAVPNNRMQMVDTAFYEPFTERPDFRRNTHVFSSEGAA